MQPVPVPSARRGLLDRPQRLGFLPTLWFWNDRERYRLAFPLVLVLSLPLVPLTFFLVVRLQLHFLLIVVVNTLAPYVALGFIERHMRGELHRRELARPEVAGELDQASPSEMLAPPSGRSRRTGNRAAATTARSMGSGSEAGCRSPSRR